MKPDQHPTLRTIAQQAGVSTMTVSLALRQHPSIPAVTRERIEKITRELGYTLNPIVSTVMGQVRARRGNRFMGNLAYVTAEPTRDGWRGVPLRVKLHDGVAERAGQLGYGLEEFWIKEPGMTGRRASEVLLARGIKGLVITPLAVARGHLSLDWPRFAVACVGFTMWRPAFHRVANHQFQSFDTALRQLKRRGYQRIGLAIPRHVDERVNHLWTAGYLLHQQKLPASRRMPALMWERFSPREFSRWFKQHRPDVVLGFVEHLPAILGNMGLRIPADVGLAHLDLPGTGAPLAGINQRWERLGAAAVDLVTSQLHRNERGVPPYPKLTLIDGEWVNGPTVRVVR